MAKVDFTLVRREIRDAARRAFDAVRTAHSDETFYAFALFSDDSAMAVSPSANTEEGYQRCIERYKADKSYMEFLASHGILFEDCLSNFRWGVGEWAYCEGSDQFDAVYEMINVEDRYDDDDPDGFETFRSRVFTSMVFGLQDLEAEGFFGTGKSRQAVTLLCSGSSAGCYVWLEDVSARRLNPPEVYEAFWNERMRDRSIAEDFRRHRREVDGA